MHPSPSQAQGTTPSSSKKEFYEREQVLALHAGVGAFNVVPLDDGFNDVRQRHEYFDNDSQTADGQREARRNDGDLAVADAVHDNDNDNNAIIPSATEYDPDSKSSPISKHRWFRLYGFAGSSILLVIIVVSISIAVTRNNRKRNNQISADGSRSQTTFPTPGPTTAREGEGILGELINISSIEKLNDPNSA
eukprot:scaffold182693_cov79-Attheya_sp.AAC.1